MSSTVKIEQIVVTEGGYSLTVIADTEEYPDVFTLRNGEDEGDYELFLTYEMAKGVVRAVEAMNTGVLAST